jgi:PKD repeat protein
MMKLLSTLAAFLLITQVGFSQVLSADFAYTWSWSSTSEIIILDDIQGSYDELTLDMGDGQVYTNTDVTHTYSEDGTYFIELKVSNSVTGLEDSRRIPVVIPSVGCNLAFAYEPTGNAGEFVFTPVSGYIFPPQGTVTWDFGDGTTATGLSNQTHVFPDPSLAYEVTISIDGANCDFTYSEVVSASTQVDCFADFSFEEASGDGMTIQFTDKSFTASGQKPSSVLWFFGEPGNPSSTESNPTFTYYDNGTYLVTYIINDAAGNCTDEVQKAVEVNGIPPLRANFFYVQPNFNNSEFNVVIAPLFTGNVTSLELDFGDGSPILNEIPDLYVYSEPGIYDICITVYDEVNNLSDTYCLPISVPWLGCNAVIIPEQQQDDPNTYRFTAYYGSQPQPFLSYTWDFGDGTPQQTTTEPFIFHTYQQGVDPEEYDVILFTTAANALGEVFCNSSFTTTVVIEGGIVNSSDEVEEGAPFTRLFPNPTEGRFFIETEGLNSSSFQVQVFNVLGARIFDQEIPARGTGRNTYEINPGSLPKGIYQVVLATEATQKAFTLLVK